MGFRIVELTVENYKRMKAATIYPNEHVFKVGGRNDQGKTSLLDSIENLLAGKRATPAMPVRKGEKSSRIFGVFAADVPLNPGQEPEPVFTVERTFDSGGGSKLILKNIDGGKEDSPQRKLDQLVSKFSFDPMEFIRLKGEEQKALLMKVTGLETELNKLQSLHAAVYDERRDVNAKVASLRHQVDATPFHANAPAAEVSAAEISQRLEQANQYSSHRTEAEGRILHADNNIVRLRTTIAQLETELSQWEHSKDTAMSVLQQVPVVDLSNLRQQLEGINAANQQVQQNRWREQLVKDLAEAEAAASKMTARLEEFAEQKKNMLASAKMPIPGLSISDVGVTYQDVPFEQTSKSIRILVSAAIGKALNPQFNTLLFRDGEGLDDNNLQVLEEWAEKENVYIFLERVGKGDECSIIIEDGEVEHRAINGYADEAEETIA